MEHCWSFKCSHLRNCFHSFVSLKMDYFFPKSFNFRAGIHLYFHPKLPTRKYKGPGNTAYNIATLVFPSFICSKSFTLCDVSWYIQRISKLFWCMSLFCTLRSLFLRVSHVCVENRKYNQNCKEMHSSYWLGNIGFCFTLMSWSVCRGERNVPKFSLAFVWNCFGFLTLLHSTVSSEGTCTLCTKVLP